MVKQLSPSSQVLFFICIMIFMSVLGQLILSLSLSLSVSNDVLIQADWSDPRITITQSFFSQIFIFLISFLLFLRLSGEQFTEMILIKRLALKPLLITLLVLLICFGLFPILEFINEPLRSILPNALLESEAATDAVQTKLLYTDSAVQWAFALIAVGVLPAICEELVFRGFLISRMLKSGMSENGAVIMSAAIFAVTHKQPMKIIAMFVLGLALGFIYRKFGNIKYPMIFHFLLNGSQITFGYLSASGWLGA